MRDPIDPFTPAVELAAAIRRKEVSPVEVVDTYLGRIDELDPRLNAFCHRADDDVRKAASTAADAVVRAASPEDLPSFHGVPLPIKDLLDVDGWPTTHGSAGASRAPVPASDPVVQRLVGAGFCCSGRPPPPSSAPCPSPRARPWASPATRGTRTARQAGPRAARASP
jgi:amidase